MTVLTEASEAEVVSRPANVRARWVGPVLGSVAVGLSITGFWLAVGPGQRALSGMVHDNVVNNAINGVVFGAVGAILLWLRPAHRVAWLMMFVAGANALCIVGEGWTLASFHHDLPWRTTVAWLASWIWVPALPLGTTVLLAVYPTGRATSRIGRIVCRGGWASGIAAGLAVALLDGPYQSVAVGLPLGHNPISGGRWQGPATAVLVVVAIVAITLSLFTMGWTVRRLAVSASPERVQLAWLLLSVLMVLVGVLANNPVVLFVLSVGSTVTMLIGIVRHNLFDALVILRSGLLYGILIGLAVGAYFAIVAAIALVEPPGTIPTLFAIAAVALLVRPAYARTALAVGRVVYGDRDDPVRALGRVGRELDPGAGTDLDAMVGAIGRAVRSPHVEAFASDGSLVGSSGAARGHPTERVRLPMVGHEPGWLSVAWRTPTDRFGAADRRLLEALAAPAAMAVHATRLSEELAESRAKVAALRDSERRSLRADLHDGVGPSLSGIALGIEAAVRSESEGRTREILGVVHHEVEALVMEIRSIIDDLDPGGFVPGNLEGALREHAWAVASLADLQVEVLVEPLGVVSEQVEVTLYRIATEGLTNVVRHAEAGHAVVRLWRDGQEVLMTVEDDGRGVGAAPEGVGRGSMRDRATAAGGTLEVLGRPGGGTRLTLALPADGMGNS